MTRKEFKNELFSYCKALDFVVKMDTVEFKYFGILFYIPELDDNTISYTPIPPKRGATSLRRIIINYNEKTLEIYKHIARKWKKIEIECKIEKKLEEIKKDFE